jgi:hypothetical protein
MTGRHAELPDGTSPAGLVPAEGRERLTLVRSVRLTVFRTFAEGEQVQRTGPVWRRQRRRVPAGLVHAADLQSRHALCGRALETLREFGRSRHAFERFDETRRCPACDVAAGRPTA